MTSSDRSGETSITFKVEVSKPVAEQVVAASTLVGVTPVEFIDESILNRLQAVDNILHQEAHIDLPDGFDAEAWRERYEDIRRPEVYDGE